MSIAGRMLLSGFNFLELRDMAIAPAESGVLLQTINELRLSGLAMGRRETPELGRPLLMVSGASRVRMIGCEISAAAPASASFENVSNECHLGGNVFLGPLSFYGLPGEDPSRALMDRLGDGQRSQLNARGHLHLTDNSLQRLTIGQAVATQLVEQATADGIFQSAAMQGNTFSVQSNVFVSALLSFGGNSFVAEPQDGTTPYGVMIATRAAAAGNVAVRNGDEAILRFLIPSDGGFSGAANQVFTSPQSTP